MEKKVKSENQQEVLQSMPVTATPVSVAKEVAPEDSAAGAQRSSYVRESLQGKPGSIDKDAATSEMKARTRTDSMLEQKLLAIIKLKQSGDETWKTELELFKKNYPDYSLPDELKN